MLAFKAVGRGGWTPGVKGQTHSESKILFLLQPVIAMPPTSLHFCMRMRVSIRPDSELPTHSTTTTMWSQQA